MAQATKRAPRSKPAAMNERPKLSPSDVLLGDTTQQRRMARSKVRAEEIEKHSEVIKEVGIRLRKARELNSLSLTEAAKLFGFANPASISKLETAKHVASIPVWFLVEAARVYEVSADYLLGLTEELGMQARVQFDRETAQWMQSAIERTRERDIQTMATLHSQIVCAMEIERDLTISVQEVDRALDAFVDQNPRFNSSMKGGARLRRTVDEAMQLAAKAAAQLTKFRGVMQATRSQTSLPDSSQLDLLGS